MRYIRKELKSQNKRLKLQQKIIDYQEKMNSLLESAFSNNEENDKEKARANQPLKTEIKRAKFDKKTKTSQKGAIFAWPGESRFCYSNQRFVDIK